MKSRARILRSIPIDAGFRALVRACAATALLLVAQMASAANCVWVGPPTGGSFGTTGNWDCAIVPGAGDDVSISNASISLGALNPAVGQLNLNNVTLTGIGPASTTLSIASASTWAGTNNTFVALKVSVPPATMAATAVTTLSNAEMYVGTGTFTGTLTAPTGKLSVSSAGTVVLPSTSVVDVISSFGNIKIGSSGFATVNDFSSSGQVELDNGAALTLTNTATASFADINTSGANSGAIFAAGQTLLLNSTLVRGNLSFNVGMLMMNGGTVRPGDANNIGTIIVNGDFTANNVGFDMELASAANFDRVLVNGGVASLSGYTVHNLINSYAPTNAPTFPLITYASRNTLVSFSSVGVPSGYKAIPTYNATDFSVQLANSANCVWTGLTNGQWNVPGNWNGCSTGGGSPAGTPGPNDVANVTGATVTLPTGTVTIGDIYFGSATLVGAGIGNSILNIVGAGGGAWASGSYTFQSMTLNITTSFPMFAISGALLVNGAELNVTPGSIVNFGNGSGSPITVQGTNAAINNAGLFIAHGDVNLQNPGKFVNTGTFMPAQSITISGNATGLFDNQFLFSQQSSDTPITLSPASTFQQTSAGAFMYIAGQLTGTGAGAAGTLTLANGFLHTPPGGSGQLMVPTLANTGATISPGGQGSLSTLSIIGNFVQSGTGTLVIDWDGGPWDIVNISGGTASFGGVAKVNLVCCNTPSVGAGFSPISFAARDAVQFASVLTPAGYPMTTSYTSTNVTFTVTSATVTAAPASIPFANTQYGQFASQVVTITNNSGSASAMGNTQIFVSGDHGDFKVTNDNCTNIVASGASCTLTVEFRPYTYPVAAKSASLDVTIAGYSTNVALTGTPSSPAGGYLAIYAPALAIPGPTTIGTTTGIGAAIMNVGGAAVTLTGYSATPPFSANAGGCGATLNPGAICGPTLNFTPTGAGPASGTFAVTSNAGNPTLTVPASGNGTATLSPTVVTTVSASVIALNTGITTVTITFTNPNASTPLTGLGIASFIGTGLAVATVPNATNTCGGIFTPVAMSTSVILSSGNLPPGGNCAVSFDVMSTGVLGGSSVGSNSVSTTQTYTNFNGGFVTVTVASPLIVTNTLDSGVGSLRDAIDYRNNNCSGSATINFNISGTGPFTIQPLTDLPPISCANTTLDGYTQPGASVNTSNIPNNNANIQIILNGGGQTVTCFRISANSVTIRGFAIHSCKYEGIYVNGNFALIFGNYIGTDPGGMSAFPNGAAGIKFDTNATQSSLGGANQNDRVNLITGNAFAGVQLDSVYGVQIINNMIGGDRAGGAAIPSSSGHGIDCYGTCNSVFMTTNYIHHHAGSGIRISGSSVQCRITQNAIFATGAKGIDTSTTGNSSILPPVITSVAYNAAGAGSTTVSGTYTGINSGNHTLEFFANSTTPTVPSGQSFAGQFTDFSGLSLPFTFNFSTGQLLNLSATVRAVSVNATSEFSTLYLTPIAYSSNPVAFSTPTSIPQTQSFVLTNSSGQLLTFNSFTVTGTGYTVSANTCTGSVLAVGATCTVAIAYSSMTPTTNVAGTVALNVSAGGITTIMQRPLSASAVTPLATTLTLTSSALNFGNVVQGLTAMNQTITVTNTGANPLVITSIPLSGASQNDYSISDTCIGNSIPSMGTCTITLGFTALGVGSRLAGATVFSNATSSPDVISLSGTGLSNLPTLSVASVTLGASPINAFGASGATSATITMTFPTFRSGVTPSMSQYFQLVNNTCGGNWGAGGTCSFQVRFNDFITGPSGLVNSTINFYSPNGGTLIASLPVSGFSQLPVINKAPASLNHGSVNLTTPNVISGSTFTNQSGYPITLTATPLTSNNAAFVVTGSVATPCAPNLVLVSGASCGYVSTYTPTVAGAASATYTLNFNDGVINRTTTIGVNGTGAPVSIAPLITSAAPPGGTVGVAYTYTGTATGTGPITWSITTGTLPPGLTLNGATGVLSGTPTAAGTYNFTVQAANGTLPNATVNASIVIGAAVVLPTVSVAVSPASISANGASALQVTLTNGSAVAATAAGFTLAYPANVVNSTTPGTIKTCTGGSVTAVAAGTQLAASGMTIPALSACTVTVSVTSATPGNYNITLPIGALTTSNGANATAASTTLTVTTPLAPAISFSPTSLNLGSQAIGGTSSSLFTTLTNTGTAALAISNIALTGDFAFSSNCPLSPLTLAAGGSCDIDVAFSPLSLGVQSASITVTSNATNGASLSVPVTGTGTPQLVPNISIDQAALAFGNQAVGSSSAARSVIVTNTGQANLALASITVSGGGYQRVASPAAGVSAANCGTSLAPQASCHVSVVLAPIATGALNGSIVIVHNAPGSPATVTLTGTGTPRPQPLITVTAALTFADQIIGTSSAAQSITLTNSGTAALVISAITPSGTNVGDFSLSGNCVTTLNPAQSCSLVAVFQPATLGAKSALLSIASNANNTPNATLALSGNAVPVPKPVARLGATILGFGNVIYGSFASQGISLANVGTAPLQILGIDRAGNSDFAVSNNCGNSVAVNGQCTLGISFTPHAIGSRSGTISIRTNADNSPHTVQLGGSGCRYFSPAAARFFLTSC